ncbi:hypothetical protein J40TS1_43930 [Paenibacillus montaniterrae]|uniref:SLH domain-containing protein n=1 Tax=Paenibacillus montaniterrae TaxID=429341 RepID=A0A919YUJ4_9BACL|nr:LamG-like jellyroll fold domain-containing protein [Paenibacillus montaniterrae]GIP18751.1 hypothetical protein J40TS1_43930 [Paenibacillus montaniterrae]
MPRKSLNMFLCAFLAVVIMLPGKTPLLAQAGTSHWAAQTLNKWEEQGLLLPDFAPDEQLTRLGFVAAINHMLGIDEQGETLFTDLDPQSEEGRIVNIAAEAGYIKGYADGSFRPAKLITREEAAVIIARIFSVEAAAASVSFKDEKQLKNWSKSAVLALVAEGYLKGYPDGSFKPERGVTFAELITMLNNIVDVIISKPGEYSELTARNLLITAPNVVLKDSSIERNLYVSRGAVAGQIEIENSTIGRSIISSVDEAAIKLTNVSFGEAPEPTPTASPTAPPSAATPPPTTPPVTTPPTSPTATPPAFAEVSVHDPSIVKKDKLYYVFGTHGDTAVSSDLISWQAIGNGYTPVGNKLYGDLVDNLQESFAWAGHNDSDSLGGFAVWAPDVVWVPEFKNEDGTEGAYLIYYSVSSTYIRSAIGVAASKTIEGPYQYVDTIMYSGFTSVSAKDNNSEIDKHWENTKIADLIEAEVLDGVRPDWFTSNGSYNNALFPNAIDANLYRDTDNKLWMSYGSWSGGIFVLEIDPTTGKPVYPGEDGTTDDGRMIDRYFGTKISGGYTKSGEGPYVMYDPKTKYYYLFVTYGWLGIDGEYNMRLFRSESPTGPFLDASGKNAVLPDASASNADYGNKLMGHYAFDRYIGEPGSGNGIQYISPGHNSAFIDENGKRFVVFHTRFSQTVDGHQLRVHQLIMNEDGWLVATPYRYSGETLGKVTANEIVGEYRYINHGKDSSKTVHRSAYIKLEADGSISGAAAGKWELKDDYTAIITIGDEQYKGAFLYQWDSASQANVMVFAALSDQGQTIWGSKLTVKLGIAQDILQDLSLGSTDLVANDLTLPTIATRGIPITWTSSNPALISNDGKITRPSSADKPEAVTMTASFVVDGQSYTKSFAVTLKPVPAATLKAQYSFESSLKDELDPSKSGTVVGNRIDAAPAGEAAYGQGVSNQALYFDGETGIVLPNDLIDSYNYSVAMWLNPEQLNSYTTAFFAAADPDHWISVLPGGNAAADTQVWHRAAVTDTWFDAKGKGKLAIGEWTHLAITVEEGLVSLYINGDLTHRSYGIADLFSEGDSIFSLAVNYWDAPYKGYMDELKVYEGVLTQVEVKALLASEVEVTDINMPITHKIMSVGQSYTPYQITALPGPAAGTPLSWSIDNPQVATIDEHTGAVTALASGTAQITATSAANPAVTRSYSLYVVEGAVAYYDFNMDLTNKAVAGLEAGRYVGNRIISTTADEPQFTSFNDGSREHIGLVLDGEHGVTLPNHYFSGQSYTISIRAKLDAVSPYSTLFFAQNPAGSWLSLVPGGLNADNEYLLWSGDQVWFDGLSGVKLELDKWVTLTAAVDGANLKLYIDGELKKEYSNMPVLFNDDSSTAALAVNHWDIPSKGIVDELYIFDYALTAEEIAQLHQ